MQLITETYDSEVRILIIAKKQSAFLELLKQELKKMHVGVFVSIGGNVDYLAYDVCFFVDYPDVLPTEFLRHKDKKIIYVFTSQNPSIEDYSSFSYEHKIQNIKVVFIQSTEEHFKKDIETLLWFAFSRTDDIFLHLYHQDKKFVKKTPKKKFSIPKPSFKSLLNPKSFVILGLLFLIATHIMFIPPLAFASVMHFYAAKYVIKQDFSTSNRYLKAADTSLQVSESLYNFPKATLHFFSIALFPEDVIAVNESVNTSLHIMTQLYADSKDFSELLTIKDKSPAETSTLYKKKDEILTQVANLHDQLIFLEEKIPTWNPELENMKTKLTKINASLEHLQDITPHLDSIFGRGKEKKYLLLFANNMELRPGGGFIGSFAIVKIKDYSITSMHVYDVYDADGQLKEQVDPPKPIVDYLNQTHFYLRDSAFSPDFVDNYAEAKQFLDLELNESGFDGGILLTTTAVQNLLSSMDSIYIPNYKDTITSDNFYLKAQLYAEDDFFPGSQEKKRFLASVMDQMMINLPQASFPKLLEMTEKSLNEKQIVFYMDDPKAEEFIENNFWSGRTLTPKCNLEDSINCILDYVLPFDANLGVNKANYFIQRPTNLDISIDEKGQITNTLTAKYINSSYDDVFPGGIYKNYFQMYLPPNTRIKSVTVDDTELKRYDETNFEYKTVGFLVTIPPQASKTIKIRYTLPTTIVSGNGVYQLIFQKQIGSPNYDFQLSLQVPNSISVNNKNFSPLVKGDKILYNTSISSDKIFVIEFSKK